MSGFYANGPLDRRVRPHGLEEREMDEQEIALREGEMIGAEDAYFKARPQIDCNDRRKVFQSGFTRGWDAARPDYPHGLRDGEIDAIAEQMPGGLDGFLKQWGWRQFARAIEDAHGVGPNTELRRPAAKETT